MSGVDAKFGKFVMAGEAGKVGKDGMPVILPPAGVGPVYDVLVTADFTVPPPTTTAPFTLMVLAVDKPRLAFEPAEKIVPVTAGMLDAEILPVTVLPLASTILPWLKIFPEMLRFPVDCTNRRLPIEPP